MIHKRMYRFCDESTAYAILDKSQCPYVARSIAGYWCPYTSNSVALLLEFVKGQQLTKDIYTSAPLDVQKMLRDEVKRAYEYLRTHHRMIHYGARIERLIWTGNSVKIIDL